jgi:hypothetical protein
MVSLQIPLLFDISAGGVVFGETVSDIDLFDAHLNFNVAGDNSTALGNEFKKILYADASENDISGALFYGDGANLSTTLANVLSDVILSGAGTLVQPNTATADPSNNTAHGGRYMRPGIPLPNYSSTSASDESCDVSGTQGYYTAGLCDSNGTSFGRILIRLMATHLMGHPFAQAFIANESAIIQDISGSNGNVKAQIESRLFNNDGVSNPGVASGITTLQNSGAKVNGIYPAQLKTSGIRNDILQSIYEALLGTAPERFDLSGVTGVDVSAVDVSGGTDADVSGVVDPSYCRPRALPFRENDTISFYFRPRVRLNIDTAIAGAGASYGNPDLSGVGQGSSTAGTSSTDIKTMFFNPRHRWIAHSATNHLVHSDSTDPSSCLGGTTSAQWLAQTPYVGQDSERAGAKGNQVDTYNDGLEAPSITMTGTDLVLKQKAQQGNATAAYGSTAEENAGGTVFDGHCWKITLTI